MKKEELNEYGLTKSEYEQIKKLAKKEALNHKRETIKNIPKLEEEIKKYKSSLEVALKKIEEQQEGPVDKEWIKNFIYKDQIIPIENRLKQAKEFLANFNLEELTDRYMQLNLYSAGGLGYSFRMKRFREEALSRQLTKEDIIDLFVTALEGGSNYWYFVELPESIKDYGYSTSEAIGEYILKGGRLDFYDRELRSEIIANEINGDYELNPKDFISDIEETYLGYIDLDKVLDAIQILKKDYPEVWENILLEQADASDADVFLQLAVMGEVVFG